MNFLIINPGSTSKRFSLYSNEQEVFSAYLEHTHSECIAHLNVNGKKGDLKISEAEFHKPHKNIFELLIGSNLIKSISDIDAIGIRIVAPGRYFQSHKLIDSEYLNQLKNCIETAPLHITPVLEELNELKKAVGDIKVFGISDSEFHKDLPDIATHYAINKKDAEKLGLYKIGYHGLSLASVMRKLKQQYETLPGKIIVCHLGGGASITAIKNGKSIDTSMGFSPLEGLVMATRSGDLDPGILVELHKKLKLNADELEEYLNKKSGLLGLSGKSSDPRTLFKLEEEGDREAKLALDIYAYRIRKYIGAYFAALNGVDVIVLTGAVGEKSPKMRERIFDNLDAIGITIDPIKNFDLVGVEGKVSDVSSSVEIYIYNSEENGEILNSLKLLTSQY